MASAPEHSRVQSFTVLHALERLAASALHPSTLGLAQELAEQREQLWRPSQERRALGWRLRRPLRENRCSYCWTWTT